MCITQLLYYCMNEYQSTYYHIEITVDFLKQTRAALLSFLNLIHRFPAFVQVELHVSPGVGPSMESMRHFLSEFCIFMHFKSAYFTQNQKAA